MAESIRIGNRLFVLAALAICLAASADRTAASLDADEAPPADVVPVIRFKSGGPAQIDYDFENVSRRNVRYLLSNTGGVYPLEILLYRDGVYIKRRVPGGRPPLAVPSRVRELKQGERLRRSANLAEVFGPLKPGSYELRARYVCGQKDELGLTPMTLERKLANVEIEP